jgi:hypothetical protein
LNFFRVFPVGFIKIDDNAARSLRLFDRISYKKELRARLMQQHGIGLVFPHFIGVGDDFPISPKSQGKSEGFVLIGAVFLIIDARVKLSNRGGAASERSYHEETYRKYPEQFATVH